MKWRLKLKADLAQVHRHIQPFSVNAPAALTALELMTIVLEDRRFFRHPGVDLRSVIRETSKALMGQKHGGASTIDMQFVRTATGFRQHTLRRKLYEALLSTAIQFRYEKLSILRSYLACAYFGSGLIGADAAARKMFGKDAERLGLREAALIGAMLACPRPLNGSASWETRVRRRAAYGLRVYASNKVRLNRTLKVVWDA
jgi:membrane peptidoglycan carboxypeptidase